MIRDLMKAIKSLLPGLPEAPTVDPEKFNDPLALRVSWQCLKSGSANFKTHELLKTPEDNLVYRATLLLKIFGLLFIVVGLGLLIAYGAAIIQHWIVLILGPVIIIAGTVVIAQNLAPIGFDSRKRLFYSGWRKHATSFSQVHAVQMLTKIGKVTSTSEDYHEDRYFYAYELNLVLHDSSRNYVMTYIDIDQALADADKIAKLIGVPVWNGIVQANII